ncbi:MAG: hypothetical protein MZU97_14835 [Bacillus subtilis]|nr:hypothetical protein [Bacillus subtilis]
MDNLARFRTLVKELKAYQYVMNVINWDSETEVPRAARSVAAPKSWASSAAKSSNVRPAKSIRTSSTPSTRTSRRSTPTRRRKSAAPRKALDKIVTIPEAEFVGYQQLAHPRPAGVGRREGEERLGGAQALPRRHRRGEQEVRRPLRSPWRALRHPPRRVRGRHDDEGLRQVLQRPEKRTWRSVRREDPRRQGRPLRDPFAEAKFPIDNQQVFSNYLLSVMKFDRSRGLLKKSVHPFTWNTSPCRRPPHDALQSRRPLRIGLLGDPRTRPRDLRAADRHRVRRDPAVERHDDGHPRVAVPHVREHVRPQPSVLAEASVRTEALFPSQLKGATVDDVVYAANKVEASLIRTEADELTYPLHIMLRYDIERMLFSGKLTVDELPAKWNELMKNYLGIVPSTDSEGVLQDVHWSAGLIGYFPTYALGTAYAAQIYRHAEGTRHRQDPPLGGHGPDQRLAQGEDPSVRWFEIPRADHARRHRRIVRPALLRRLPEKEIYGALSLTVPRRRIQCAAFSYAKPEKGLSTRYCVL